MLKQKLCCKCGRTKPAREFHKKKELKSGLHSWCKRCRSIYGKKYRKTPCGKQAQKAAARKYKENHFDRVKRSKWAYQGIDFTLEEYNQLFEKQNGCCFICGRHQSENEESLCVDHNHETGQIRNLVCRRCNTFIGFVENFEERLESIKMYLKKYKNER